MGQLGRAHSSETTGLFPYSMESLQIGTYKIDQILSQVWGDLLLAPVDEVKPDVRFEDLTHKPVDSAANRCQQHELAAAFVIGRQGPFHCVQLSAQLLHSLQQLDSLAFMVSHVCPP